MLYLVYILPVIGREIYPSTVMSLFVTAGHCRRTTVPLGKHDKNDTSIINTPFSLPCDYRNICTKSQECLAPHNVLANTQSSVEAEYLRWAN